MKRTVLVATLFALTALPACTAFHPERRTVTNWNLHLMRHNSFQTCAPGDCEDWDTKTAPDAIDWITVQPIALAMLPLSIACDTFIVNPIDGWKRAEYEAHAEHYEWAPDASNAEAATYAYGKGPMPGGWAASQALAMPQFIGRWIWNSTAYCAAPHNAEKWQEYWETHNEESGY
jgi:hypothetical protein